MSRFNSTQLAIVNSDNRNMFADGIPMGDELNSIWAAIDTGNIGITSNAIDVDSLALGGGHFSRDKVTANGSSLLFAWFQGRFHNGKSLVTVSAGNIALSASATNYIEVDRSGTVSVNTSGFTAGRLPLYTIVTGSSGYTDNNVTISKPLMCLIGTAGVTGDMLSTPGSTKEIIIPLGDISATLTDYPILLPNVAGKVVGARLLNTTTFATDNSNYWKFGIKNKGPSGSGTTVVVDDTIAANGTTASGSGITAFVNRDLTLSGTPANLVTAAKDCLALTVTKTGTPANLTKVEIAIDLQFTA